MDTLWKALLAKMRLLNQWEDVQNAFNQLITDEERVNFTTVVLQKLSFGPKIYKDGKDAEKSKQLREEGNKIFGENPLTSDQCLEAFKLYSRSIAASPIASIEQAFAYGNRSAVLLIMKKYKDCLTDIERAFSMNYPDTQKSKLHLRKLQCLAALNDSKLQDALGDLETWMNKLSINESHRIKINEKVASILKDKSVNNTLPNEKVDISDKRWPLPTIDTRNPEVPCASDAVTIKYNKEYGRHIVATRDIMPGEVLVIEKPYSKMLSTNNLETHCFHCLEVCWCTIPCKYCTYAMYCCEDCRTADWKACHDVECAVFPSMLKQDFNKLDFLSLRLTLDAIRKSGGIQNLRTEIQAVEKQEDIRTQGFSNDGKFNSNDYRSVYSLVTNSDKRDVYDLLRRSVDACAILYLLLRCTSFFGTIENESDLNVEDIFFVGGLIMRHHQIITSNAHMFGEESGLHPVERGVVVMPFLSLVNHNCDNNTHRHSTAEHIVLYSVHPIKNGEQIFDNYGEHFGLSKKAERQVHLLRQYRFVCTCLACNEDWPLYENVPSYTCTVKNSHTRNTIAEAMKKFNEYYNYAKELHDSSDVDQIVKDLIHMIIVLFNNVSMPCQELIDVVETLKRLYDIRGNRFEIPTI